MSPSRREPNPSDPEIISRMHLDWSFRPVTSVESQFPEPFYPSLLRQWSLSPSLTQLRGAAGHRDRPSPARRPPLPVAPAVAVARSFPAAVGG